MQKYVKPCDDTTMNSEMITFRFYYIITKCLCTVPGNKRYQKENVQSLCVSLNTYTHVMVTNNST